MPYPHLPSTKSSAWMSISIQRRGGAITCRKTGMGIGVCAAEEAYPVDLGRAADRNARKRGLSE